MENKLDTTKVIYGQMSMEELYEQSKKYFPYTEEEYRELKSIVDAISTHIPNDKMQYIWNNYKKITRSTEATPCSCGSAASHWRRAVDEIRNFITKVEG